MASPADDNVEFRFTCVLHLEQGDWKIVQWHSSIPATNEQYGFFLTKSVDDIVEAVSETRPDLSASSARGRDGHDRIHRHRGLDAAERLPRGPPMARGAATRTTTSSRSVTTEHGGTVVKGQGDGFMLAFASARRALTCSQAIERAIDDTFRDPGSPIRVRIGLHVGETVHEGRRLLRARGQLRGSGRVGGGGRRDRRVVARLRAPRPDRGVRVRAGRARWSSRASRVRRRSTHSPPRHEGPGAIGRSSRGDLRTASRPRDVSVAPVEREVTRVAAG